jgi:hypothetical protein
MLGCDKRQVNDDKSSLSLVNKSSLSLVNAEFGKIGIGTG